MLKFDGCNSRVADMKTAYPQMSRYLNQTGRRIVFSCSWPDYERATGINVQLIFTEICNTCESFLQPDYKMVAENCNLWRNYDDISVCTRTERTQNGTLRNECHFRTLGNQCWGSSIITPATKMISNPMLVQGTGMILTWYD